MTTIYNLRQLSPPAIKEMLDTIHSDRNMETHIQTEGDIEELMDAIFKAVNKHDPEDLQEIRDFYHFAMAATPLMGFLQFGQISFAKSFKNIYPKLYETIIIWAWC